MCNYIFLNLSRIAFDNLNIEKNHRYLFPIENEIQIVRRTHKPRIFVLMISCDKTNDEEVKILEAEEKL